MEATHQSATSEYAPKCTPGTREQIIQDIIDWTLKIDSSEPILWVPGPAGGGKTCIMREVAARCEKDGVLAASYFFSTRISNLDNAKPFVFTIAQQLLERIPPLRPHIARAIRDSPSIFQKSLIEQVHRLVLAPLQAVSEVVDISRHRVLPIDGFDECRHEEERKQLLHIIHILATNHVLPFRIIIASRPEYDIRTAFDQDPLQSLTHMIRLESYNADDDIRSFLCDEFAKIRKSHPSAPSIPPNWPSEDDMGTVVFKSSSQFIFAATVIRFVQYRKQTPVNSLRRVLELPESDTSRDNRDPFADLDQLYHLILNPPDGDTDVLLLRRMLHIVMDSTGWQFLRAEGLHLNVPERLDQFLELEIGTTNSVLCDAHSLLRIALPTVPWNWGSVPTISFHHRSLEDLLRSPSRGRQLHQTTATTKGDLLERCLYHIARIPKTPPHRHWRLEPTDCALSTWASYAKADFSPSILSHSSILEFDPAILFRGYSLQGNNTKSTMTSFSTEAAIGFVTLQSQLHQHGVRCVFSFAPGLF